MEWVLNDLLEIGIVKKSQIFPFSYLFDLGRLENVKLMSLERCRECFIMWMFKCCDDKVTKKLKLLSLLRLRVNALSFGCFCVGTIMVQAGPQVG